MEIIGTLIGIILVIGGIALYKYHVPGTILWGSIGIIVYLGFVVNEMSKGIDFDTAIWKFPIIGILGLISLVIGIYIELKKRK